MLVDFCISDMGKTGIRQHTFVYQNFRREEIRIYQKNNNHENSSST